MESLIYIYICSLQGGLQNVTGGLSHPPLTPGLFQSEPEVKQGFCTANGAFPLHGTAWYGSLLGGFPLGTVPGTWYFFSTTSAMIPSNP